MIMGGGRRGNMRGKTRRQKRRNKWSWEKKEWESRKWDVARVHLLKYTFEVDINYNLQYNWNVLKCIYWYCSSAGYKSSTTHSSKIILQQKAGYLQRVDDYNNSYKDNKNKNLLLIFKCFKFPRIFLIVFFKRLLLFIYLFLNNNFIVASSVPYGCALMWLTLTFTVVDYMFYVISQILILVIFSSERDYSQNKNM